MQLQYVWPGSVVLMLYLILVFCAIQQCVLWFQAVFPGTEL